MKRGEKLEIEKLKKPDFMTDGEWQATLEALTMLNQTLPDEAWKAVGDKVISVDRIRSDGLEDKDKFVSTDGREFATEGGAAPTFLLTTIGRRSGKETTTPVNNMPDGDRYFVVASLAGYDAFPNWYLNLAKNPRVWIQVKDKKMPATAYVLSKEEKARLWPRLLKEAQPLWAYFQMFTQREFPVVCITPEK